MSRNPPDPKEWGFDTSMSWCGTCNPDLPPDQIKGFVLGPCPCTSHKCPMGTMRDDRLCADCTAGQHPASA